MTNITYVFSGNRKNRYLNEDYEAKEFFYGLHNFSSEEYNLETTPKPAQIGVRYETDGKYFTELNKIAYDFKLYNKLKKKDYYNTERIIIQLESLWKVNKTEFDLIIIDEVESVLKQLTSKITNKNIVETLIASL